jgi:hypothetical protein
MPSGALARAEALIMALLRAFGGRVREIVGPVPYAFGS